MASVVQQRGEMVPLPLGQGVQDTLGLGLHGQDAFHGGVGVGSVADRPLQGGQEVGAGVGAQQGQHALGLGFALGLAAE